MADTLTDTLPYRLVADRGSFIGLPHVQDNCPSQDYTFAKTTPFGAIVVVSDGCSHDQLKQDEILRKLGIVYHTDVGARLLALAAAKAVEDLLPTLAKKKNPKAKLWHAIRTAQQAVMHDAIETFGLTPMDLMATWLCAVVLPDGRYWVLGEGDGVVALKRGSVLDVTQYSWLKAPFYPAYRLGEMASFKAAYKGAEEAALQVTSSANHEEHDTFTCSVSLAEALEKGLGHEGVLQVGDDLMLFTDGIGNLAKPNEPPMGVYEAVGLVAERLIQPGPFRVRASSTIAMRKLTHAGYQAHDDLSLAVVSVFEPTPLLTETTNETPT